MVFFFLELASFFNFFLIFLFFKNFILFLNFTILYWFCQIWNESATGIHVFRILNPPHTIPLGHPSAPAPSIQYRALIVSFKTWNSDHPLKNFFSLFVFGCAGSLFLHELFSGCNEWGLFSSGSAQASHCSSFSCGAWASVVVACRL